VTVLGELSLWLALLLAAWGTVVGVLGGRTGNPELALSARRTPYALLVAISVASISLLTALLRHDFNVQYVYSYTSRNLPTPYLISAFYGGQAGSLLFWALVLCGFAAAAQWLTPRRYTYLMPYVAAVTSAVTLFFVMVSLFAANPFARLAFTPPDGAGLNPQLQNPGMVFHPPLLFLGYVGITIPFAFAVAALITKRLDTGWLHAIRKWTIVSWIFLSAGITLGMWWAYVELGWGGYWAWDPVENASLMPWLAMTAFLHSVMIQEKRGMLKKWNMILVMLSFLLCIFGTFITRSGIVSSVHSFAQSSVGTYFVVFLVVLTAALVWLLWSRLPLLKPEAKLESMVSREATFLFNNLLLVGMAFSVLWGTMFPVVSELVRGTRVTVGPPFFNQVNIPIGLALLALTGIGPLIAWRKASTANLKRQFLAPIGAGFLAALFAAVLGMRHGYALMTVSLSGFVLATIVQEFWKGAGARHRLRRENYGLALARLVSKNRRRYGGYIIHFAIVIYFVAFIGEAYKTDMEASLLPGEAATLRSAFGHEYSFTHVGVSQYDQLNRFVSAASVEVTKGDTRLGIMTSEKRQYWDSMGQPTFQPSTEPAIRSGLLEDLYITYAGSVEGTEEAVYRFAINPMVWWLWFGGVLLVVGGVVTLWPGGTPSQATVRKALEGYQTRIVDEEVATVAQ
jgi:cytochrome c-type biogenesis protein CcmF